MKRGLLWFRGQDALKGAGSENPYLTARKQHNDMTKAAIYSNRMWQFMALVCLFIALAAVGGVVALGTQSRLVPYVVEVDKLGQTMAVKRADRAEIADERVIRATLASFIRDSRMVSFDRHVQNEAIWRVFSHMKQGDAALLKMTAHMQDSATSPVKRAETESVGVEIVAILPQNEKTWEVTWTETVWNKMGQQTHKQLMRCLLNTYSSPPTSQTSEQDLFRNPLGIFVKDFSWSRMLE